MYMYNPIPSVGLAVVVVGGSVVDSTNFGTSSTPLLLEIGGGGVSSAGGVVSASGCFGISNSGSFDSMTLTSN